MLWWKKIMKPKIMGMDQASGPDQTVFSLAGRGLGKSVAVERAIAEYTRRNPDAVIMRITPAGTIIEKPVIGGSHEFVKQEKLK
jgi:hypothetical protein